MGQQQNRVKPTLSITLEKNVFLPGEYVNGFVHLHVSENETQIESISIQLVGEEQAWWRSQSNTENELQVLPQRRYQKPVLITNKNVFLSQNQELNHYPRPTILLRGVHSFSFSFQLPNNLLSSSQIQSNNFMASTIYKLLARGVILQDSLQSNNAHQNIEMIQIEQMLTVHEAIQPEIHNTGPLQCESAVAIKTWGMFDRGQTEIKGFLDRSVFLPTDTMNLILEIDNGQCNIPIQYITVALKQLLQLRSSDGVEQQENRIVWEKQFSGAEQGAVQILENSRNISLIVNGNGQDQHVNSYCMLTPTHLGTILRIQYMILVRVKMDGCIFCAQEPELLLPIVILKAAQINEPQNVWQAQAQQQNYAQM